MSDPRVDASPTLPLVESSRLGLGLGLMWPGMVVLALLVHVSMVSLSLDARALQGPRGMAGLGSCTQGGMARYTRPGTTLVHPPRVHPASAGRLRQLHVGTCSCLRLRLNVLWAQFRHCVTLKLALKSI